MQYSRGNNDLLHILNLSNEDFVYLWEKLHYIMEQNGKQERVVVHLEINGEHYYYGNLRALTDAWSKEDLGVSYNYLKNMNISPGKPYFGKKCTIRKGIIQTSPREEKRNGVR